MFSLVTRLITIIHFVDFGSLKPSLLALRNLRFDITQELCIVCVLLHSLEQPLIDSKSLSQAESLCMSGGEASLWLVQRPYTQRGFQACVCHGIGGRF